MISIMFLIVGLILIFLSMGLINKGKKGIELKGNDGREYFLMIRSAAMVIRLAGGFLLVLALIAYIAGY